MDHRNEFATISIYPRKGTETQSMRSQRRSHYFNLSPQGDGNHLMVTIELHDRHFNLSPQGDGNLDRRTLVVELDILTYPRKGTET